MMSLWIMVHVAMVVGALGLCVWAGLILVRSSRNLREAERWLDKTKQADGKGAISALASIPGAYQMGKWLPDGPGYSPDGGNFWCKGELVYWEDGEVTKLSDGVFRALSYTTGVDYSQWDDIKRAAARAEYA